MTKLINFNVKYTYVNSCVTVVALIIEILQVPQLSPIIIILYVE